MINPNSLRRKLWDSAALLLIYTSLVAVPMQVGERPVCRCVASPHLAADLRSAQSAAFYSQIVCKLAPWEGDGDLRGASASTGGWWLFNMATTLFFAVRAGPCARLAAWRWAAPGHATWPQPARCFLRVQIDIVLNCITGRYDDVEQRVDYNLRRVVCAARAAHPSARAHPPPPLDRRTPWPRRLAYARSFMVTDIIACLPLNCIMTQIHAANYWNLGELLK